MEQPGLDLAPIWVVSPAVSGLACYVMALAFFFKKNITAFLGCVCTLLGCHENLAVPFPESNSRGSFSLEVVVISHLLLRSVCGALPSQAQDSCLHPAPQGPLKPSPVSDPLPMVPRWLPHGCFHWFHWTQSLGALREIA